MEFTQASNKIELITKAFCNISDNSGSATAFMANIDPNTNIVMLNLYEGMFKFIPLDKEESTLEVYTIRYVSYVQAYILKLIIIFLHLKIMFFKNVMKLLTIDV